MVSNALTSNDLCVFLNKIWPVLTELICQAGHLQVSINGRDYNVMGPGCEAGAGKEHGKDGEENSGDPMGRVSNRF